MEIEQVPELTEEQLAPGANESDSPTETQDSEAPAEPDEAPKPRGVQKRLDELTANWRAAERREAELRQVVAQLAQQQKAPEIQPTSASQSFVQPSADAEPSIEQFDSWEEFSKAHGRYVVRQELAQARAEEQARQQQVQHQALQQTWWQKVELAQSQHQDFAEVAGVVPVPPGAELERLILTLENGPDVLYGAGKVLANNPSERARFAQLPAIEAAFALGSLAASLQTPTKATPRPVPQPINPLAGGNAAPATDPDKMSSDQWLQWRRAQLR